MDQQIDPGVMEQVLSMQDPDEDPAMISNMRRQKMVDAMRGRAAQQSDGHMMGKVYAPGNTAATALSQGLQGAMLGYQQQGINADMAKQGETRTAGRKAYFGALTNAMRRKAPEVGQGMGSNIGPGLEGAPGVGGDDTPGGLEF